jgi:hypothetical protein
MLTNSSVVTRKEDQLLISKVDDEYLMMDIDKGAYISLNSTASIIWEQIEKASKVDDIVQHLMNLYDVEKEICLEETLSFLNSIQNHSAIDIENS